MKMFRVQVFTEEYAVNLYIGTREECIKEAAKYTTLSPKTLERNFSGRGLTYNLYPDKHPLLMIDGDMPAQVALATIAHEAIHAIDYMMEHIGIDTKESEFRAHGVSVILRTVFKYILKKK